MKIIATVITGIILTACGPVTPYYPTHDEPSRPPSPVPSVCTDTIPADCQ